MQNPHPPRESHERIGWKWSYIYGWDLAVGCIPLKYNSFVHTLLVLILTAGTLETEVFVMADHMQACRNWATGVTENVKLSKVFQNMARDPKVLLYGVGFLCLITWLAIQAAHLFRKADNVPSTPDLEKPAFGSFKAPPRKPGVWEPVNFKRPTATPAPNWDVYTSKPTAYRPFRHGTYHITMGLRNMPWDEWIELDNHYLKYHAEKAARIKDRGTKCSQTDPSAYPAALELLSELCSYLPERYPTLYKATAVGMDNIITGESFNIHEVPLLEDPMQMAARMVQDDLAIMIEKEDGQYYLLAGSILLAGFWKLEDKVGMCLSDIHTSGSVPGYKEKLEKGMMNFMKRVQPNGPVQRNNYFIQVDNCLSWSPSIGDEDGKEGEVGWFTAEKNKAIAHHYFRSERQSLRRLPKSGGVVFTIRTYFHPITEICEEDYVPGRLASAVRSWGDDVSKYKGRDRYGEVLLEYLDGKHREQVENGLEVEKEEEVRKYPF